MLFFLYGEDAFRSKQKLNELKRGFLEKNPMSVVDIFDFSEKSVSPQNILESFSSGGLFSTKKLVIIESLLKEMPADSQKTITEKIKKDGTIKEDPDLVIIFRENGLPKKNLSLFKCLELNSRKQEFPLLDQKGLEKWVLSFLSNSYPKLSFTPKPLSMFVSYVGNDLFLLKNELEKIATYKMEGELTEEDVDLLVNSQIRSTIFNATEALLNRDKKLASKLLHEQIEKGEDLFYILAMCAYQIRTLLRIAHSIENGNLIAANIAKETGLHPYVVQKSLPQARLAGTEKLKKIFSKIKTIDLEAKTGKRDLRLSLDTFIAQI